MSEAGSPEILYVLDRYPELSQTFVHDEIAELRRQSVDVRVAALKRGEHLGEGGQADWLLTPGPYLAGIVALARIGLRHPGRLYTFVRRLVSMRGAYSRIAISVVPPLALKLLTGPSPTRVHAHFAWGASSVAAYISALLDIPLSITVHARDIFVSPQSLQAKFTVADPLVTVCTYNQRWLEAQGYRLPRVVIVPCGVDASPVIDRGPATATDSVNVIGIGRLVPKKGFDVLIRAAAEVIREVPRLKLEIIGEGPERSRLSQLISELGIGDNVVLAGALPHDVAMTRLAGADLFALACRRDGDGDTDALPVVIREAMSRGVAVVTTSIAGIPETVTPDAGWVVPPDDVPSTAAALRDALLNEPERRLRGTAARERVEQFYTLSGTVMELKAAFGITSINQQ